MSVSTLGCGAPDCEPQDVITNMVQERGRLSASIYQIISCSNPFVKVLEPSKEFFPSGMGDTLNEVVFDIARPNEKDVTNWQHVRAASPGYNPCCVQFKEIPYGSRTVSACLYRDGWMSPKFCKVDLSFKYQREKQIRQQKEIMAQWSKDIWAHWSVLAYQRSVTCLVLNSQFGLPEQLGAYPAFAKPTSALTFQHLEAIFRRIKAEGGELGRTVPQHELVFIGAEEFAFLEEQYIRDSVALGYRSSEVVLPEIGSVRKIGKYMFVIMDTPRRFRDPGINENWEDALVESLIQVPSQRGTVTSANPDYYNSAIAKYSEFIYFNASAAAWLLPAEAMTKADGWYPASNYSGEFMLINPQTDCDPFQETLYFAARYMSGMIARFPKRARAGLALAVHARYKDVCVDSCGGAMPAEPEKLFVLDCAKVLGASRLQLLVKGVLPEVCPDNHSLFAVTKKGNKFLINSVISQEAYAGDSINTEGGTLAIIDFPTGLSAAATCREECDGWDYIACLPANTPSSDPTVEGCGGCSPNTVSTACTHTGNFYSDTVLGLVDADGVSLLGARPGGGYTAESFETAVQDWLDDNGGGTATVTEGNIDNGFAWSLVITGSTAADLVGAQVVYEDGLYEAFADIVRTGDCD
jgi:hypothetical protein